MSKKEYLCSVCGSNEVEFTATKYWDIEKQQWVDDDQFNWESYCHDCSSAGGGIEWQFIKTKKEG